VTGAPGPTPLVVGVIGPGRAGLGLALALARAGHDLRLYGRRAKPVPAPLTLTTGPADAAPPWIAAVAVLILAVPDDAISPLAGILARGRSIRADQVVLHLSGLLGHEALAALLPCGAALGSLHPLQTLIEPEVAPDHLRGAWAAVEGMPRAVTMATRLAQDVGLRAFPLRAEDKPRYHAGAVFASNYFVVVEALAQELLQSAGLEAADAWRALAPLVRGTFDNLQRDGPRGALTGPVARGDAETVARHLAALGPEVRELYRRLGEAALDVMGSGRLDAAAVTRVKQALATAPRPVPPPVRRS